MLPRDRDSYDKKIFRLISILNKLDAGKVHSSKLAEAFGVSQRSIQRDLELLNMTGFPLMSQEKGVWEFAEGFSLRKAMLTNEEASLLAFLYEIVKSLGKRFEEPFNEILKKVIASDTESAYYAKIPAGMKLGRNLPHVKELEDAIANANQVEFYYEKEGKEKWLRVDPLKMVFFDGFWYLVCRVHGEDWILKLRLENIKKLKVLDSHFSIPRNLMTMLDESVNAWFSEKRDKKVVVKVDKHAARFFRQNAYLPLQKIAKENKDGSLIVEAKACQYMEVIPVIQRWIPHVHVIEPKEVKDEIKKRAEEYLKNL